MANPRELFVRSKLPSPKTLFTVQALRAIAASGVVAYHTLYMLVHNAGYSFHATGFGAAGVDLFFLISGFIMIYTSRADFGRLDVSASFLRRRVIRIVPMYWLYTTLVVVLLAFAPRLFSTVTFNWKNAAASYLFLLSKIPGEGVGTVMQTGWTLCFEAYFYVLFAIFLNWPRRYLLVGLGFLFMAGSVAGNVMESVPPWLTVASDPILFEFYFGLIIGVAFIEGHFLSRPVAIGAILVGVTILIAAGGTSIEGYLRPLVWGLPCGLILLGAISLERAGIKVPKLLVALGDSSYSLYLAHPFILPALGKGWRMLHLTERVPPAVLGLIAFLCAVSIGHVLYLLIEKPVTERLSRHWRRIRPAYS